MNFEYSGECFYVFYEFQAPWKGCVDYCVLVFLLFLFAGFFSGSLTPVIVIWSCSLSFFCPFPRPEKDKCCLTWLWPACCGYLVLHVYTLRIPENRVGALKEKVTEADERRLLFLLEETHQYGRGMWYKRG